MARSLKFDHEVRKLTVRPDVTDLRDRYYRPSLVPLAREVVPGPEDLHIRNQYRESTCTAFAAVIDRQSRALFDAGARPRVSPRMLWEMARLHDDLPDRTQRGSTLRGALKGFFHNGVCQEDDAPYTPPPGTPPFRFTTTLADRARGISLGAYFRLDHEINDYHSAINEAGSVIAAARLHEGWAHPVDGVIGRGEPLKGGHAFAIVGYDREGFLVQNSWGDRWGGYRRLPGVALWSYEDWHANVEDAWVLRLAISSPRAFNVKFARNHKDLRVGTPSSSTFAPRRQDIMGHYLHSDDGRLVDDGRYAQDDYSVQAICDAIEAAKFPDRDAPEGAGPATPPPPVDHLLLVGHGALQDRYEVAKRAKAWRPVFLANGIYPVHLIWETGFNNQVVDVLKDVLWKTRKRMGTDAEHLDERLEALARPMGRKLWRDLKTTARMTTDPATASGDAIRAILANATGGERPLRLHFMTQSGGALLLSGLADTMADSGLALDSATLFAPACSIRHYDAQIRPHLGTTIAQLDQYNLIDHRERADKVELYGKSALYLVSRALEDEDGTDPTPLLGMQQSIDAAGIAVPAGTHRLYRAGYHKDITDARGHRGFDRDVPTMNSLLRRILGIAPERAPDRKDKTDLYGPPGSDPVRPFSQVALSGY